MASKTGFFDLPAELRIQIYEGCFESGEGHIAFRGRPVVWYFHEAKERSLRRETDVEFHRSREEREKNTRLNFLLAHPRLCSEVFGIFSASLTFAFKTADELEHWYANVHRLHGCRNIILDLQTGSEKTELTRMLRLLRKLSSVESLEILTDVKTIRQRPTHVERSYRSRRDPEMVYCFSSVARPRPDQTPLRRLETIYSVLSDRGAFRKGAVTTVTVRDTSLEELYEAMSSEQQVKCCIRALPCGGRCLVKYWRDARLGRCVTRDKAWLDSFNSEIRECIGKNRRSRLDRCVVIYDHLCNVIGQAFAQPFARFRGVH